MAAVIIVSEIGDKVLGATCCSMTSLNYRSTRPFSSVATLPSLVEARLKDATAAILAMRHPRLTIFAGAFFALALMSLLSALLGHVLPTLLPRRYTTIAAAALFFVFGAKMLKEGIDMEAGTGHIEEEMREVQKEVEGDAVVDLEAGANAQPSRPHSPVPGHKHRRSNSQPGSPTAPMGLKRATDSVLDGVRNLSLFLFSPVLVQAFVLTFLAEWGDRSQITTIALAAAHVRRHSIASPCRSHGVDRTFGS
jgi:putative Ca2+/H+ antiporter (TMEM165/GDT1 family)